MKPARSLRVAIAALSLLLPGCAGLSSVGPALQTADAVAKGVCGAIVGGATPQDALAAFQAGQRAVVDQAFAQIAERLDPKVLEALRQGMAANADALRALSDRVLALAAAQGGPAPAPPKCPAAGATSLQEPAP